MIRQHEHHYLLANVQAIGVGEALRAGWTRTDKVGVHPGLITLDGQRVAVTSGADRLVDLPPETTIYLAKGWLHAFGDPLTVLRAHKERGGKVVHLDGREDDWI
jgi:hypothetical protein